MLQRPIPLLPEGAKPINDHIAIFYAPIKHMCRQNQHIFRVRLANPLILLMAKFTDAADAQKTWCGKYLLYF